MLAQLGEVFNGVGEIANRGDAGGDVKEGAVGAEMLMHVPQAGKQHLAAPSMTCAPGRGWLAALGRDTDDSLAVNGDALCRHRLRRHGIENRDVLEDEIAGGMVNELFGQAGSARDSTSSCAFRSVPNVLSNPWRIKPDQPCTAAKALWSPSSHRYVGLKSRPSIW